MPPSPTPIAVKRSLRDIGEHLRTWRKLRGLTVAQVAERAGLARTTVTRIELDPGAVSIENLLRVARAVGVLDARARGLVVQAVMPVRRELGAVAG